MIVGADEQIHAADPAIWSWNESWYFSFIDLEGGPAGFFRVGVLPNQRRAMLWAFVHVTDADGHTDDADGHSDDADGHTDDAGEWLGIDESRLHFDDLDTANGIGYDQWALSFAWTPESPLQACHFSFAGQCLARSGPRAGAFVPVTMAFETVASAPVHMTGTGTSSDATAYPTNRFEQSLSVNGSVQIDDRIHAVRAGGHRDKSWGPRDWRVPFIIGDLQSEHRQLYFVGRGPGAGSAYLRDGSSELQRLQWTGGHVDFDDPHHTITSARLELSGEQATMNVDLEPIGPSMCFDMAHTCEEPEHWLYYRALVNARVPGWPTTRGWFEASRYPSRGATS